MSAQVTGASPDVEERLARFVAAHEIEGLTLPAEDLCAGRPDLLAPLQALIDEFLKLARSLDGQAGAAAGAPPAGLPDFPGFRTIERIGGGGMGEVYKLEDLTLHRTVAAKVMRPDATVPAGLAAMLKEARSLALFRDRRIVQVHECRADSHPPVIIMEHVDGFDLGRLSSSLEYRQRARIVREICEAIDHAHALGLQHRDLKPTNIMLDGALSPKILDFGLSSGEPGEGHFVGTPSYLAPEQLDPALPIDARTDVYGLGAVLYEVLCQAPPHVGATPGEIIASVREGRPRLPVEIVGDVP
ncbi:MAG TPA: serine/threonine-protein kinase, partial [Vicinamibacterales bacterium]|nr:serine/threonine-protein kinase [Vicinamibacterales bacterium]